MRTATFCFNAAQTTEKVGRFQESRDRDCALARAECTRELKKAREAWMSAEKVRTREAREHTVPLSPATSCGRCGNGLGGWLHIGGCFIF